MVNDASNKTTDPISVDDPHVVHCCLIHGCRFNNSDKCTVFKGIRTQARRCGESSICSEYRADIYIDYDDNPYN